MKLKTPKSRSKPERIFRKKKAGSKSKKKSNVPKDLTVMKKRGRAAAEKVRELAKYQEGAKPVISPDSPPSAPTPILVQTRNLGMEPRPKPFAAECKTTPKTHITCSVGEEIHAALDLMRSVESWFQSSKRPDHANPDDEATKGGSAGESAARTHVAALSWGDLTELLDKTCTVLLQVSKAANDYNRECCLEHLIDTLVRTQTSINSLMRDESNRALFAGIAERRTEFPLLVSTLAKQNSDAAKFVLEKLKLGGAVPGSKLVPSQYSPFNNLAKKIMTWILSWQNDPDSIYWRVAPVLGESGSADQKEWKKIISFHLDYFQSPTPKNWRKYVSQYELRMDAWSGEDDGLQPDERYRNNFRNEYRVRGGPVEDVTEDPEFKKSLKKEEESKLKTPAQFYNRVKHKVLTAARTWVKSGYPKSADS